MTPGLTREVYDQMRAQGPLVDVVTDAQTLPGAAEHFAGASLDIDHHAVSIAWHGAMLDRLQARITKARKGGIQVTVTPAAFSRRYLDLEIDRLDARIAPTPHAATGSSEQRVEEMSPAADGSGIDVKVSGFPVGGRALTTRTAVAAVPELTSSVPLHLQSISHATAPGATLTRFHRQDDYAPFWGGDAIINTNNGNAASLCSTGFSVYTSSGSGILTAAHCGWNNWYTLNGNSVGRTVGLSNSLDVQVISASAGPFIWDGDSMVSTNQFDKAVSGARSSSPDQWICTSPAASGVSCGIKILQVDVTAPGAFSHADYADNAYGNPFVGPGDSGGPVFFPAADGTDLVQGTIFAGPPQTFQCPGWQGSNGQRRCSNAMWYADWNYTASTLGLSLMHSP